MTPRTRKELHELIRDGLDGLTSDQAEVFQEALDEELDTAFENAHKRALASRSPEALLQAYHAEIGKAGRGSPASFEIRRKYRALGLKI